MVPYSYQPLDQTADSIRIVVLEAGEKSDEIRCQVQHVRLHSNPKYEALSYVCGNPANVTNINPHGHTHRVTTNLVCALRYIRRPTEARVLWIDPICIDQKNFKEREQQVKMMTSIYSQAESVISWLGEAKDQSDDAIELIENFGRLARAYLLNEFPSPEISHHKETMHWHDFFNDVFDFPMEEQNWAALWKLFERPYWSRVWMVQEMVGAGVPRNTRGVIKCGNASVEKSLYDYTCAIIVMMSAISNDYRHPGGIIDEPRRTFELMGHPQAFIMWELTAECAYGSLKDHGFDRIIKAAKRFQATDNRDMIYALLGIAPQKYRVFPADYAKPLKEVLISFVGFMVEIDGNLDSLLGNRFQIQKDEPSWTPELFQTEHGWVPGFHQLCAAAKTNPIIKFDDRNETISCSGILVGRVNKVIGPEILPENVVNPGSPRPPESISDYTTQITAFGRSLTTSVEQEKFWRTLVLDHDCRELKAKYPAPDEFGAMAGVMFFGRPIPENFMVGTEFALRYQSFVFPFKKSWERIRWNRCFFTTKEGHMGIGPFCIRPNDIVVMLYGGEFLFVLREDGSKYKLVGDAYVHGYMHGDLVKKGNLAESPFFTIT